MISRYVSLVRLGVSLVCGAAVGAVVGSVGGLAVGLLSGWGFGALVACAWILVVVWPMDAAQTRAHAQREFPGRRVSRFLAVAGSVASLGAVAAVLVESRHLDDTGQFLLAGVAVASVIASWALIQTDYMLRLAVAYYAEPVGGIDFNQSEDPMYTDFAYVSVGLGMTYQISDTNLRTNEMRRIVIAQTLLAYLFGAVILATVVNLVAGLGG